jgi:hypothetical protein
VGWRGTVKFDGGGAGTVVADDVAQVLQHGEGKRRVRWGSRRAEEVQASGSPSGGTAATARWKIREGSSDFGVRGRWTESREDRGGGGMLELRREGAKRKRGTGWWPVHLNALDARQREKRRGGGPARRRVGAGEGAERGRRSTMWADTAWARRLQAALTAASGARRAGMADAL